MVQTIKCVYCKLHFIRDYFTPDSAVMHWFTVRNISYVEDPAKFPLMQIKKNSLQQIYISDLVQSRTNDKQSVFVNSTNTFVHMYICSSVKIQTNLRIVVGIVNRCRALKKVSVVVINYFDMIVPNFEIYECTLKYPDYNILIQMDFSWLEIYSGSFFFFIKYCLNQCVEKRPIKLFVVVCSIV